jgi:hypothetical protein
MELFGRGQNDLTMGLVQELVELSGCGTDARGEGTGTGREVCSGCATGAHHGGWVMGEQSPDHLGCGWAVLGCDD